MRQWMLVGALALATLGTGCATSFVGDAKFPGGARACFDKCQESGMVMAAFVYMGEYSTGCICQPRQASGAGATADAAQRAAATGAVASAAGVMMQMRRQEENRGVFVIH